MLVTATARRLKLQRRMADAVLFEQVFQTTFYLFHLFQCINDNMCSQGVVGCADSPDVQVVYLVDMLLVGQQLLDFVRFDAFWRTIDNQTQTTRQQTPCREQNDEGNDEADNGVNNVPPRPGNNDSGDNDTHGHQRVRNHVQKGTTHIDVTFLATHQQDNGETVDIAASNTPVFKAGKAFKAKVN